MRTERYPGERVGLRSFVSDMMPIVESELGRQHMLLHAIRRALQSNSLDDLRRARRMFNILPRDTKRRLSAGFVSRTRRRDVAGSEEADGPRAESSSSTVVFATKAGESRPTVKLLAQRDEQEPSVQVSVKCGTLPAQASRELRRIADVIDGDRRLLSARHWARRTADDDEQADSC